MKICLNCGDKLLDLAKNCPSCGANAENFSIVDRNDTEIINEIRDSAENIEVKKSFWQKAREQGIEANRQKASEKTDLKERIKQMDKDGIAYCPKCYSTSLSANKKGFGIGKAVLGAMATGGIGLVAGNIGAKKVRITCLKCGHQFMAGKK